MGLVVFDTEAEGNGNFDEAMDSDHEGSEPPTLIGPSSNESTPQRSAIADVLLGLNDTFHFWQQPTTIDRKSRMDQPNPVVPCRLLQSTNIFPLIELI